jgi:hypothetical protein
MSARYGEWHLLDHDSDPVPGSPVLVGDEAEHYATVATTIASQARRLRRLAADDAALKGHYADALQEGMNELADDLDKIHDRFEVAGSQLAILEPALDTARLRTKNALDDAVDAQARIDANAPSDDPVDPSAPPPTQADKDAEEDQANRHSAAEADLTRAKTACRTAISDFDEVADDVARKIRAASDDDMKDSRWDKFKGWVGSIASKLSILADILGYLALALTVIAMFIPGLNVLVLVLALTVGSLLIHTLLASTGNGSWVDVAFDVVGLLTLGIGNKALNIAKAGRAVTLTRAASTSARTAESAAFARTAWNGGRGLRGMVSLARPSVRTAMRTAYADEFARVVGRPVATSTTVRSMLRAGGDREVANLMDDLAGIRVDFPGVNVAVNHVKGLRVAAASAGTGLGADLLDKSGLVDLVTSDR